MPGYLKHQLHCMPNRQSKMNPNINRRIFFILLSCRLFLISRAARCCFSVPCGVHLKFHSYFLVFLDGTALLENGNQNIYIERSNNKIIVIYTDTGICLHNDIIISHGANKARPPGPGLRDFSFDRFSLPTCLVLKQSR